MRLFRPLQVEVEDRCGELTRRQQFVKMAGVEEWPDGTVAGRYSFLHALYQNVLYDRIGAARRVQVHQQIEQREEAAYRD